MKETRGSRCSPAVVSTHRPYNAEEGHENGDTIGPVRLVLHAPREATRLKLGGRGCRRRDDDDRDAQAQDIDNGPDRVEVGDPQRRHYSI